MPTPTTIGQATRAYLAGKPFFIRLEYRGANPDNESGYSSKWWTLEYDPVANPWKTVRCNWGATGTAGRANPVEYDFEKASKKFDEKMYKKGYTYCSTTRECAPEENVTPVKEKLASMPFPYNAIHSIIEQGDGLAAVDENGALLMSLLPNVAQDLIGMSDDLRTRSPWPYCSR